MLREADNPFHHSSNPLQQLIVVFEIRMTAFHDIGDDGFHAKARLLWRIFREFYRIPQTLAVRTALQPRLRSRS
jgi:hypothetical protein